VLLAAARRFVVVLGIAAAAIVVLSLALGALVGSSADRAISLGLYIAGSIVLVGGFFVGNRGPLRAKGDQPLPLWGFRPVRRATGEEREEAINFSALLIALGFVLIALGVVVDSRFELI